MSSVDSEIASRWPRFARHRFRKPVFVLQERDCEIMRLVADYRVLSSEDIRALIGRSSQMCLRRLQKLYHAGYLDRPRYQRTLGNVPMIYTLGERGVSVLAERFDIEARQADSSTTWLHLSHALMVSRIHAVLQLAGERRTGAVLDQWRQDAGLWDQVIVDGREDERIPIAPDAWFVLRLTNEPEGRNRVRVFLEADRGTMTHKRFATKMRGYWHYWQSGKAQERFGAKRFLVATVARTLERTANLRTLTAGINEGEHGSLRMFVFGALDNFSLEQPERAFDSFWTTAGDNNLHSILE
jgi:hypothetical protein